MSKNFDLLVMAARYMLIMHIERHMYLLYMTLCQRSHIVVTDVCKSCTVYSARVKYTHTLLITANNLDKNNE